MSKKAKKEAKKEPQEYVIECKITRRTEVIVIADSEENAAAKFENGEWEAEDPQCLGDLTDFVRIGRPKENK